MCVCESGQSWGPGAERIGSCGRVPETQAQIGQEQGTDLQVTLILARDI